MNSVNQKIAQVTRQPTIVVYKTYQDGIHTTNEMTSATLEKKFLRITFFRSLSFEWRKTKYLTDMRTVIRRQFQYRINNL